AFFLQISSTAAATSLRTPSAFSGWVRRSTVMHLSSRKPGLTHSLVSPVVRIRIMDLTGMGAMVLNWFVESEEVFMLQMVSPLILKLSLFLVTAVATHLVMSFGQTFLHYKVAHNPIGGKLFRNHPLPSHPLCRRSSC